MVVGVGGHSNCNASLSQRNVQKNSRALVRGRGGALNLKQKICWKNNKFHT